MPPISPPATAPAWLVLVAELLDIPLLLGEGVPEGLDVEFVDMATPERLY